MNTSATKKRNGRSLFLYVIMLLILFSVVSVATYTWFSLSRTPQVSDMGLYVNSPTGMELSADPLAEEWQLQLNFSDLVEESGPLRPVTWSENDDRFYAATYGFDGRLTDNWEPLNDERHANKDNADGYYLKGVFYARSDQKTTVSLSPAVEVEEGLQGSGTYVIGTPVWNGQELIHNNGGNGAELAIRIGFLIEQTDLQGQVIDGTQAEFYIYEPNCNSHVDGSTLYVPTESIDITQTLVPQQRLILQTASQWSEAYPVQRDAVIRSLGEFTTDTELFTLVPGQLARISLYVWLEGQDVDCTNQIGHEAQILASIQFAGSSEGQSGMVSIEN